MELGARPQLSQLDRPDALELPCAVTEHVEMKRLLADEHVVFDLVWRDDLLTERTRPAVTFAAPHSQHWLGVKDATRDVFPRDAPQLGFESHNRHLTYSSC